MAETAKEVNGEALQSLLSSPARDFLVRNDGEQVKIGSLKGKKIGLYFSASWCGPCQEFTPQFVQVYNELSPNGFFEVVYVSLEKDEKSFQDYFSKMPWLAVPFTDFEIRDRLDQFFEIIVIPNLVMIDDQGKLLNETGDCVIQRYGADAYPFTEELVQEIEVRYVEMAKGWPKKVKHKQHELELTRSQVYMCNKCDEEGQIWSYSCQECDFHLHVKCALKEETGNGADGHSKDGWVCEGNVCSKKPA